MQESSCNEPVSVEANEVMNLREWREYAGNMQEMNQGEVYDAIFLWFFLSIDVRIANLV